MNIDFKIINASSKQTDINAYNEFVNASPQGIFFCKTWWLDAVAPGRYEVLILKSGDSIKAAWPLVYRRNRSHVGMPLLTQKLGILFAPSDAKYAERLSEEHKLMKYFFDRLPSSTYVDQLFHENFTNWLPFYWRGCRQTTRYTYILEDMSNLDAVWENIRPKTRGLIRKAQGDGMTSRESDDINLFYEINKKSFERQRIKMRYDLKFLSKLDLACKTNAGRNILLAEDSHGRLVAGLYAVYDRRCTVSLLKGADPQLRRGGAQAFLEWEAIKRASKVSRKYDFEGSMIADIEFVFRNFGATQIPYFQIWGCPGRRQHGAIRNFLGKALRESARFVDP